MVRRSFMVVALLISVFCISETAIKAANGSQGDLSTQPMTRNDFDNLMKELSNWGRWGKEDQNGTMNLITLEKRIEAARLVKYGLAVSLARPITPSLETEPKKILIDPIVAADAQAERITLDYHGQWVTHIDSLSHMFYKGRSYNGFPQMPPPSSKLGVENKKQGVFTRGVLIDIPRLRGVPYLSAGSSIGCDEVDAWLKKVNVTLMPGDALFIRTGRSAYEAENGASPMFKWSGLDLSCARWLKKHDIAVLGSDYANELSNEAVHRNWLDHAPFHLVGIVAMGMTFIDNCDLEAVAVEAARLGRWEFLVVATPLFIPGGTGSPVNPIAVF